MTGSPAIYDTSHLRNETVPMNHEGWPWAVSLLLICFMVKDILVLNTRINSIIFVEEVNVETLTLFRCLGHY